MIKYMDCSYFLVLRVFWAAAQKDKTLPNFVLCFPGNKPGSLNFSVQAWNKAAITLYLFMEDFPGCQRMPSPSSEFSTA